MGVTAPFLSRPARAVERVGSHPGSQLMRPADYFLVVVGAFWLVVVAPPWAVVLAPLCRLVVVGLFLLPPLSLLPHDAAKNSNGTSATTNRPYTIRGIPTCSCRMSCPSRTARLHLPGRFGQRTEPDGRRRGPVCRPRPDLNYPPAQRVARVWEWPRPETG